MPFIDVLVNADWSDWQNYPAGRPNPLYSQQALEWNVDGLILAFITLATTNEACWAAQPTMPLDWAKPIADDLNAANKAIIVSFGGASNSDISKGFTVEKLIDTYETLIEMYQLKGLDFDLENDLYDIAKICQALNAIQKNHPDLMISFTLPTLPSGLVSNGLMIVKTAADANIEFVINGMAMDYYDANYAPEMGQAAIDAAESIAHQLATYYPLLTMKELLLKVAITPMIVLNNDLSLFTLGNANQVGTFAQQNPLAFIGEWSFNRDNPSSYTYVDLQTSRNSVQKVSGEYANDFIDGLNN